MNYEKKEPKNVIISDNNTYYIIPSNNIKKKELKYPLNLFNKNYYKKNNFINVIIKNNKKTISILSKKLRYKR